MRKLNLFSLGIVSHALLCFVGMAQATMILYQENFHNTIDQQPISNVGWAFARSDGSLTTNTANEQAGRLSNVMGVDGQQGVAYNYFNNGPIAILTWWDNGGSLSQPQSTNLAFSTWVATNDNPGSLRFALRIDTGSGQEWFITRTPIENQIGAATNFPTQAVEMTLSFTTDPNTWTALNYVDGDLSSGFTNWTGSGDSAPLTNPLPSGNITAWGVYASHHANFVSTRYDAYTVTIPEPGSLLLIGIAIGAFLLSRRKR